MLRAKQLGTLSQSARSLFLNGSRYSAADGSSATFSDDETSISRTQTTRNEPQNLQTPPSTTFASKTSSVVNSLISREIVKAKADDQARQLIPASPVQDETEHSSPPPISDQFVKAGIVAVNFLSDLVNYKIPVSDGSGILGSNPNCMIDRARPITNIKSSNVKSFRQEKVPEELAPRTSVGSNRANVRGEKSGPVKAQNPNSRNPVEIRETSSDSHGRRRSVPPRARSYPNPNPSCFAANLRNSEEKIGGKSFVRSPKVPTGAGHMAESISHVLRQMKWGPMTEEALQKLNFSMDAYQANQILKQIRDHSVALGFFYWLKQQPGFKHDGHTYTTMVGILGRDRQFGTINKLLEQMIGDGCRPNVVTYNRLIHSYGRANYLSAAMEVFNRMREIGCEPDRVTYCTLIDIHAKSGYLDIAMDLYQKMQEVGLSPDTFTYSVIINCLGKAGHLAATHKLFCEMINQGCVPNLVTYNIMIALQAKARNYPCALQVYRDMQSAGFEPDRVTYSIVMEVLGHCGYLEETEAVFAEMVRKNWVPDEPVYGLLVDLWGKAGNPEKAWGWYHAMLRAGLCPNVPTCNSLLSAFLRVHRLSDAYNLLQGMLDMGLNPSLQTYTLLLSCCTEARTPYDMTFCGELMAVTGHPAHAFLLSMPSAGPDGQNVRDHVSGFLDMMHSEDRESKRGLVDAVVDFLHKSGLKEEAGSVWEVAAGKNVYPDAVREKSASYWLINLHVMSDGTAVTALSRTLAWFRRKMIASGIGPARIDIVTGWGRRSRVTGSSMVRQAVEELLNVFSFPFFTENGNSGCFVGCGEPLNRWLLQSYVERMHLL